MSGGDFLLVLLLGAGFGAFMFALACALELVEAPNLREIQGRRMVDLTSSGGCSYWVVVDGKLPFRCYSERDAESEAKDLKEKHPAKPVRILKVKCIGVAKIPVEVT